MLLSFCSPVCFAYNFECISWSVFMAVLVSKRWIVVGQQHQLLERGKKLMILSVKRWIAGLGNCYEVVPVILGQQHLAGRSNVLGSANLYLVCICKSDDASNVHFICICLSILWQQNVDYLHKTTATRAEFSCVLCQKRIGSPIWWFT